MIERWETKGFQRHGYRFKFMNHGQVEFSANAQFANNMCITWTVGTTPIMYMKYNGIIGAYDSSGNAVDLVQHSSTGVTIFKDLVTQGLHKAEGGIAVPTYVADYGGGFANFTPPAGVEGMIILAEDTNTTTPGVRLYAYINGAWHYVDLT